MRRKHLQPVDPPRSTSSRSAPAPAPGGDWLHTMAQELGNLPRLLRHMRATCELPGLDALDGALLRRLGVSALIWDADGTLMRRGDRSVAAGPHAALQALLADPGLRHVILSNCGERRFVELGEIFPAIPLLRGYRAAGGALLFRVRQSGLDRWRALVDDGAGARVAAGSWNTLDAPPPALSGARPLRKPSVELVRFALAELGVAHAAQAACIGDQRLTDVAGASLAGCLSVKVPTLGRESFPLPVRILQLGEEALYRTLYRQGRGAATSLPPGPPATSAPASDGAAPAPVEAA